MSRLVLIVIVLMVSILAADGRADEPVDAVQHAAPPAAGLTVHIDPETGEILGYRDPDPRRLLDEQLEHALSRSSEGLEAVTMPDGTVYVDLQGRFHFLQTARVDEHGELQMHCVDTVRQLMSFVDFVGVRPSSAREMP